MSHVVVVGGGIATVEFVLAFRAASDSPLTIVAPSEAFVLRTLLIRGDAPRLSLRSIAESVDAEFVLASVASVSRERRCVVLRGGGTVDYDTLVLAPGARTLPAFDGVLPVEAADAWAGAESVAFVAPTLVGWSLPLYEAALLTARRGVRVSLHTPEARPLEVFGAAASDAVAAELAAAGVAWFGGAPVDVGALSAERVVALPLVRGPRIDGVPEVGLYGFIPVDGYGRVTGLADAYAIGDATDFPLKQGGLACAQADIAAAHIAGVPTKPFVPELRATLLTGTGALELGGGQGPDKIPGRHLAELLHSVT